MKQLRIILMALFAMFALGAVASATATAEEGFLKATGEGHPAHLLVEGGVSNFETTKEGSLIQCQKLDDSLITLENDKHGTGVLHWLGCKAFGLAANTDPDKAEEILAEVLLLVCLLASGQMAFAAETDKPVIILVPALGISVTVEGRVIGQIVQTKLEEKTKHYAIKLEGSKGKQAITECKEGAAVKKHTLTGKVGSEAALPASEEVKTGLILFLEEVILMDK